jgi:hypothetical protein
MTVQITQMRQRVLVANRRHRYGVIAGTMIARPSWQPLPQWLRSVGWVKTWPLTQLLALRTTDTSA